MMRLMLLLLLAAPADAGQFLPAIAVAVGATADADPAPAPAPANICENCNGTGRLGDGTVSVECPVCGGDGRVDTAASVPVPADGQLSPRGRWRWSAARWRWEPVKRAAAYPSRSVSGRTWTGCPDWTHLTRGEHAGQFDPAWLASLSPAQVQALHADSHENRVRWEHVQRPTATFRHSTPTANCPTGNCPATSARVYSRTPRLRILGR